MNRIKFGDIVKDVKVNVDRMNNPYEYYVAGDHMDSEDLTIHRKGRFATDDVGPAFVRIFKPGQILYGSRRTYLKKVAVADFSGICANTTFVLESKDHSIFDQRLLPFIMLSDSFTSWSISKSKGSTNPYVLFSDLADYEFNLPSLEEQKVLADKLWAAYRLKEGYKKLLAATDEMVKSQFIEMFSKYPSETPWHKLLTIINGKAYPEEYNNIGTYPICGSAGIMYYGERKLCDANTIILGRKGNINHPIYMESDYWIVDTAFCLDVNKSILLPKYFYYWCCQYDFTKLNKQGVLPSLTRKDLEKIEMSVPPMAEQKKFVSIVEQADKSKFGDFKSQFIEMFGDAEKKPFVDVCINKGEYGSNSPADDYDGNIRYVRITDITEEGNLNSLVVSPRKVEEKYMLLRDDLLFARTGNTVGKTYLHRSGRMIFAGYLIRYRLNNKLMLPQFAFAYTHTNQYYDWVEKIKKVGAQPNISAAQYDSMPIPVPSMAKQIEFVSIAKQADKSKSYVRIAFKNLESMLGYCIRQIS